MRIRGGTLHGPNPTWGKYLYVGSDGRVGTTASVAVTNGNLHIDCEDGYALYLNWYSQNNIYTRGNLGVGSDSASHRLHVHGTGYATSDFRAPIFYDSNDTNYYLDPNSASRINRLNISDGQVMPTDAAGGRLRISSYTNGESVINGNTHNITLGPYSTRTGAGLYYAGIAINGLMNYNGGTSYDVAPHIWLGGYYRDTPGSERSDFVVAIKSGTGTSGAGSDLPQPRFRVDYEGIASATGSFRAPIFYDSQDTTYYLDPNSTGSSLVVAGYTKSKFTYRNNPAAGLPGQDYPVKTATGVLATLSSAGYGNEYIIIKTRVPQDSYQMGGFTIDLFARYNDSNAKTTISLGGYWNPESNGGFAGWEYNTTNPNVRTGIFVMRDVTD